MLPLTQDKINKYIQIINEAIAKDLPKSQKAILEAIQELLFNLPADEKGQFFIELLKKESKKYLYPYYYIWETLCGSTDQQDIHAYIINSLYANVEKILTYILEKKGLSFRKRFEWIIRDIISREIKKNASEQSRIRKVSTDFDYQLMNFKAKDITLYPCTTEEIYKVINLINKKLGYFSHEGKTSRFSNLAFVVKLQMGYISYEDLKDLVNNEGFQFKNKQKLYRLMTKIIANFKVLIKDEIYKRNKYWTDNQEAMFKEIFAHLLNSLVLNGRL